MAAVITYPICTLWHATAAQAELGSSNAHDLSSSISQSELMKREKMSQAPQTTRRTIRRKQLREIVPLADSTIYDMEQRGEFPRRFALSPRCIVWDLAEVEAWLLARRAAPIRRAQHPDVTKRRTRPVKELDLAPSKA
ncbi:phage transcriptional regulator AlpA [Rhizobium sp. Pop5]|nr:phage transcriptional regulator AlpA [Rhizobium sp. Pop5]